MKMDGRFDVTAIYFRVDSTRSFQRERFVQTSAQMVGPFC